jgi:hypothetical protein
MTCVLEFHSTGWAIGLTVQYLIFTGFVLEATLVLNFPTGSSSRDSQSLESVWLDKIIGIGESKILDTISIVLQHSQDFSFEAGIWRLFQPSGPLFCVIYRMDDCK